MTEERRVRFREVSVQRAFTGGTPAVSKKGLLLKFVSSTLPLMERGGTTPPGTGTVNSLNPKIKI